MLKKPDKRFGPSNLLIDWPALPVGNRAALDFVQSKQNLKKQQYHDHTDLLNRRPIPDE
jgi:hypothetical protein